MSERVYVTGAQKAAARAVVKRTLAKGKIVPSVITKIANAPAKSESGTR